MSGRSECAEDPMGEVRQTVTAVARRKPLYTLAEQKLVKEGRLRAARN